MQRGKTPRTDLEDGAKSMRPKIVLHKDVKIAIRSNTARETVQSKTPVQERPTKASKVRSPFCPIWTWDRPPEGSELLHRQELQGSTVSIYSLGATRFHYHVEPWEANLPIAERERLLKVMEGLSRSPPAGFEDDPTKLRKYAEDKVRQLLTGGKKGASSGPDLERMVETVLRYTVGYGLLEILLADERVEDVFIDAPCESLPWHVTLAGLQGRTGTVRAETNILCAEAELEGLIGRMRHLSGRPFSRSLPVLETDLPQLHARATAIAPPLSPDGLALALRRHSQVPWTLPRMVLNGTMSLEASALLSFLVDGRSSLLVCGPRGAGKSSLLSALMIELPAWQRVLTIEDTPELPVRQMQDLGYKVQSLLVEDRLEQGPGEAATDALRVSLRLGESALVLGEVRGEEARVLYEGMRTGKAGSAVLGTIHGEGALSVFQRVVHDLRIPAEAFASTDIVATMGLVRQLGGTEQVRHLVEVMEQDRDSPPGSFLDLLARDRDRLERSSLIHRIARSWGINTAEAMNHLEARAGIREVMLDQARGGDLSMISPAWVQRSNQFLWARVERAVHEPEKIVQDFAEMIKGCS